MGRLEDKVVECIKKHTTGLIIDTQVTGGIICRNVATQVDELGLAREIFSIYKQESEEK